MMRSATQFRAAPCSACSLSALRLFVGNFAPETRSVHQNVFRPRRFAPTTATSRFSTLPFRSTTRLLKSPAIEETRAPKDKELVEEEEEESQDGSEGHPAPEANSSAKASDVPWYLQVEPPRHPTLMHEPPPLPEIPNGAPKITETLLKYVSDELGMDDLTVLDLREMDPPPAMGPDVIMVFGTARSEPHLHVSADCLVRWLRGRGISAKTDGLIGRNQLKTKLKRIARKAKLLGTSAVPRDGDYGISTGWICVNLGTVGASRLEVQSLDEEGRPTGFGVPQRGTTIVVQMLTERRRQDLDLETFWADALKENIERNRMLDMGQSPTPRFPPATPRELSRASGRKDRFL